MSKQVERRRKAKMIRAASKSHAVIECEAVAVDWQFAAEGEGQSTSPKCSMTAYTGGPVRIGWYPYPVVVDLAGLKSAPTIPLLRDHLLSMICGHADQIEIGSSTIKLSGFVSGVCPAADEVRALARNKFPWQASIGVIPDESGIEFVGEGIKVSVNGKTFTGPLYVCRKGTLRETSFVAVGADGRTSVKVAASAAKQPEEESDMNFEQWIEAMGLVPAELRDDQKVKLQAKYDAEVKAAADSQKTVDGKPPVNVSGAQTPPAVQTPKFDLHAVELAHVKHSTAIEAKAIEYAEKIESSKLNTIKAASMKTAVDLKLKALAEEWAAPRLEAEQIKAAAMFEAELIRAERPKAPAVQAGGRDGISDDILAAACVLSGKLADPEKHAKPEALEAAHRRFRDGIGLQQLLMEAAWANGYMGRYFKDDPRSVMNYAFHPIMAGGFSTVSIAGILSNTANKFLLEGFFMVERVWRSICAVRTVNDFKTVTSYRLTGSDQYDKVGPAGEIKHGTLGEESYTNKADTYAKMLAITRQDIINDDLGAITSVPRKLGRGSGLKINDVFWTAFLDNATFFTAANGTYFEGAATALGIDSLTTAERMFMDLQDADGKPIGHTPAILLTPTGLSATAAALFKSMEIRDTTASTKYPVANPHAGKFRPEVSRYLGNSSYSGYSATAFYLLGDPNEVPVIEVAFLNGQEAPTIETADAAFNVLGIEMRGYHDFGVSKQDYRGGVKSKGAV